MDNLQIALNKFIDLVLRKIDLLPGNPLPEEIWEFTDPVHEWEGLDFISDFGYLQISVTGQVQMFDLNLKCIFESQI